jgi:hypothetical protein
VNNDIVGIDDMALRHRFPSQVRLCYRVALSAN